MRPQLWGGGQEPDTALLARTQQAAAGRHVRREAGRGEQARRVGGVPALQLLRDWAQAGPGPGQQGGKDQEEGRTETR